jgi:flagellar export protein FliJ
MRAFQFPLRKALDWRRTQRDVEEGKLRQLVAELREMEVTMAGLGLVRSRAEQAVCEAAAVEASDLWALAAYRARLLAELQALARRKREREQQIAAQRELVRQAQRQCRLLEKLEERRFAEWRRAADRETENLASESFLARWRGPLH